MSKITLRQAAVLTALAVTLIANALAQMGTIVPNTVEAVANTYRIYFLPANYVFGIWGLIYTGLIAYAIFQALPSQRASADLKAISWVFIVSCAVNSLWLFLFLSLQFWLSTIVMLTLLGCLTTIYQMLGIGLKTVPNAKRWLVHMVPYKNPE